MALGFGGDGKVVVKRARAKRAQIGFAAARVVLVLCAAGPARAADAPEQTDLLSEFVAQSPKCPAGRRWCFGIQLHVVVLEDGPVQTAGWLAHQVAETNRHFAPLNVGFELAGVRPLDPRWETVTTRRDRDLLGREPYSKQVLHAFLIGHLANVDAPGEIRGVHWRDRAHRSHHWVVLASIAPDWVLAHEIGHFFGLPHSRYPESIMNKTDRAEPPWDQRTFAHAEYARMKRQLRRYLRTRELRPRAEETTR